MGNDFKKMMNEKMEEASLDEVMPEFDKHATWNELEERIPAKKKKVVPVWWTHAATLAAGLILGAVIIKSLSVNNADTNTPAPVAVTKETKQPEVIVKTDTVFITKEVIVPPVQKPIQKAVAPQPTPPKQETRIAQKPNNDTQQQAPIIEPPVQDKIVKKQQPEAVAQQSKPAQPKPIHLLDIDNENRQDALYHNDPSATHRSGFALQISTKRLPDKNNQQQPSLLNNLFKK